MFCPNGIFHNWSPWQIKQEGNIGHKKAGETELSVTGKYIIQQRTCVNCGLTEIKTDKVSII